jgi:hypothetical protein
VPPRYFTVEQANAALERVRPLAEELVAQRRALLEAQARLQRVAVHVAGNGGGLEPAKVAAAHREVETALAEVMRCAGELQELGAQVKDPDEGLLDFPALRRGEEVLLCWKLGEDEIGFWHTLEAGFAGRRPLPLDY